MCRSVPGWVLVTLPKFVSCALLSGVPNCGVLNRFSPSARNSALNLSVIGKYLKTEKSKVLAGGEVLLCRPRLPWVRFAGAVTAVVSNQWSGDRPPAGAALGSLPETRSGKQPAQIPTQPLDRRVNGFPV